jgi:YaaC-like protein
MQGVVEFSTRDVSQYAWARLGAFENVEHTASQIEDLHKPPASQRSNIRKQATQLKYCLIQAREYADAARAVSLATKPVLLYYSAMSLALCEVLFKQDGNHRLEKLREHHNCHGLTLGLKAIPEPAATLTASAGCLIAKAQLDAAGLAKGTFEVWRKGAGEYPVMGELKKRTPGGFAETTEYEMLFKPDPKHRASLGPHVSLLDCLTHLPSLKDLLGRLGTGLQMVRATPRRQIVSAALGTAAGAKESTVLIVHPTSKVEFDAFLSNVICRADAVNTMTFHELPGGVVIHYDGGTAMSLPPATSLTTRESYFACKRDAFNEFGYTYIALHLAGNFARYFPDLWLKHIESSSPLAMAISELTIHALDRLPLLTLSEMTRTYHVERAYT